MCEVGGFNYWSIVQVCELMFVESRVVSHIAGDFATRYLFSDDFTSQAGKSA